MIHYNLQFCHTYANEAVLVEKALAKAGIPLLRIETDTTAMRTPGTTRLESKRSGDDQEMKTAGLDVGSRTIVLVTFENGCREHFIVDTGPNPLARSKELLAGRCYDKLVVTGLAGILSPRR